jgi:fructokinase
MMKALLPYADILKVADEELMMLTGTDDFEEGSRRLAGYGISLVMVTLGADGVFVRRGDRTETIPGIKVKVADTNGAGDTFLGAMLMQLTGKEAIESIEWDELLEMVRYANKAASVTCSRSGAIPAMPRPEEVK